MLLYTTIGVATIGGSLALGDRLLDTAYWPNTAEYGQNLFIFVLTCYLLIPDSNDSGRWEWIASVSFIPRLDIS